MRNPHKLFSLLLLLCLISACGWAGRRFGSKDEGGIFLIIAVKADAASLDQSIRQTIEVMEKRCDQMGIYCKAQRHGGDKSDRIMLRISNTKNPERIKSVILSQGLEIRAVVSPPSPAPVQTFATREEAAAVAGTDKDVLPYLEKSDGPNGSSVGSESFLVVERTSVVSGRDISDAQALTIPEGALEIHQVNFTLTPEGAMRFGEWTAANINKYIAVVLNKEVRSVAYIKSQILDRGQISGRFTKEQAEDAAMVLRSGNLPAPIEALEEGLYKP
jgi:preprotein translocase subunit SecD